MGIQATGTADMSSRHHARESTRVIYDISELSKKIPFSLFLFRAFVRERVKEEKRIRTMNLCFLIIVIFSEKDISNIHME